MSYLIDTSIWASYFRTRGTPLHQHLNALIEADPRQVLGCPPVRMELAVDPDDLRRRRLLRVYDGLINTDVYADDFDLATEVYRAVQRHGHTVRSRMDCVIAAVALRADATVVHDDVDFDRMAEVVTDLSVLHIAKG